MDSERPTNSRCYLQQLEMGGWGMVRMGSEAQSREGEET